MKSSTKLYKYTLELLLSGAYNTSVCIDNNRDNCVFGQAIFDTAKFQYRPSLVLKVTALSALLRGHIIKFLLPLLSIDL